ncbi:DUF6879 family protein [Streptomyces decoyicus]|uniref:DUF6879 family protein n=1 Tax=Streptomyces decoyicus TaxID=249567 RepID=UPI003C12C3EE
MLIGSGATRRQPDATDRRSQGQPASEYIRYEHAGTYLNIDAGEQVRWLPRRDAATLALPGADLWLLDDQLIRFGHFSGAGASAG